MRYELDSDGLTPLRVWSNTRNGNGEFVGKTHLVKPVRAGDRYSQSLCGLIKRGEHGFPDAPDTPIEEAITCVICRRLATLK